MISFVVTSTFLHILKPTTLFLFALLVKVMMMMIEKAMTFSRTHTQHKRKVKSCKAKHQERRASEFCVVWWL